MPSITTWSRIEPAPPGTTSPPASPPAPPIRCGCWPASGRSASSRPRTAARRSSPAGGATSPADALPPRPDPAEHADARRRASTPATSRSRRSSSASRRPPGGRRTGRRRAAPRRRDRAALPAPARRPVDVAGLPRRRSPGPSPCGPLPDDEARPPRRGEPWLPPPRRRPRPRRPPAARRARQLSGDALPNIGTPDRVRRRRRGPRRLRGLAGLGRRAVQPARRRRAGLATRPDGVRLLPRHPPERRPVRRADPHGRASTAAARSTGTASTSTARSTSAPRRPKRPRRGAHPHRRAGAGHAARHAGAAVLGARGRPPRPRGAAARRHRPAAAADDRDAQRLRQRLVRHRDRPARPARWCDPLARRHRHVRRRRPCCARTATRRPRRARLEHVPAGDAVRGRRRGRGDDQRLLLLAARSSSRSKARRSRRCCCCATSWPTSPGRSSAGSRARWSKRSTRATDAISIGDRAGARRAPARRAGVPPRQRRCRRTGSRCCRCAPDPDRRRDPPGPRRRARPRRRPPDRPEPAPRCSAIPTTPLLIPEEEVPREGAVVRRSFQAARWHDGRLFVWLAHRKSVGRGEGSSGLRFDTLTPI